MSIKGFKVNNQTERYDYEYLDNQPDIPGITGDIGKLNEVFDSRNRQFVNSLMQVRPSASATGKYTIIPGEALLVTGYISAAAAYANRAISANITFNGAKNVAISMEDSAYKFRRVWTHYPRSTNPVAYHPSREVVHADSASQTLQFAVFDVQEGETFCIVSFSRADETDPTPMDESDAQAISNAFKVYVDYGISDTVDERTLYNIDPSDLEFTYGGVDNRGKATGNRSFIRLKKAGDGAGAIDIGPGSSITPGQGYMCNIAVYSRYRSNSDFDLKAFYLHRTDSLYINENCSVRIAVATSNSDILWTKNDDETLSYTQAGLAAIENGVTYAFVSSDVKSELDDVKATLTNSPDITIVRKLENEIPLNAVAFHALFDDYVTNGYLTRTLLGTVDNDVSLPLYMYTMRNDMDHISTNYSIVSWDGSNELYTRPKIVLTSGLHGNERTTPFVLFDFIKNLIEIDSYQDMRNSFDWYFIPLINPWGFGHTAQLISSGSYVDGSGYSSENKSNYNIFDNTSSMHNGIRQNKDGIDINRDFGTFATVEAQYVRSALTSITSDGSTILFASDLHQAFSGGDVNRVGAFLSLSYGATAEAKNLIYKKWMQAGGKTEKAMADYCDVDNNQSVFCWEGSDLLTLRNYFTNYATYGTCFEGGQTIPHYSGSTVMSNPIARTFNNTQLQTFMTILTKEFM